MEGWLLSLSPDCLEINEEKTAMLKAKTKPADRFAAI